MKIGIICKTIL